MTFKTKLMSDIIKFESIQYSHDFTKKDAVQRGKEAALEILDAGNVTPLNALTNAVRLKEVVTALEAELRKNVELKEATNENGMEISLSNTGDRLDYEQDEVYKELSEKLKERGELLKLAYKSKDAIYDSEGILVPKVGIKTHGKEVIKIKF